MIMLRAYRVTVSPKGKMRLLGNHILRKWDNFHDFGFDIFQEVNWLIFLKNYKKKDGSKVPRVTNDGEEIAYEIYIWGTPTWMKDYFNKSGINDGYHCLFPGYEKGKKKDIAIYGVLQRSEVIKDFNGKLYIKTIWNY